MKEATKVYEKSTGNISDSESEEEVEDKGKDAVVRIPKVCFYSSHLELQTSLEAGGIFEMEKNILCIII